MGQFKAGDKVVAIHLGPLAGNDKGPELETNKVYEVREVLICQHGREHLDIGLPSQVNFIRSYPSADELERGDTIHWCHPSRFLKVN